jgi:hypothetical protein
MQSWLRPVHMPVLDPSAHYGMTPITNGVLSVSHDPTVSEFCGSSIKISMSTAGTGLTARLPLSNGVENGVASTPIKVGSLVHVRVRCSDWSAVTRLYLGFTQDGGMINYYLGKVVETGTSKYGLKDPTYADKWTGQWRTLVFLSSEYIKVGSAASWGSDARYFSTDGISLTVTTTAAVDIHINRIYSPDWPVSVICPILDGNYKNAREIFLRDFSARGWGFGVSGNAVIGTGIYPTMADMAAVSASGNDVFCHGHYLSGTSPTSMTAAITEAQYSPVIASQRRALMASGCDQTGLRWHQWLTNIGTYSGTDLAGVLRKFGIDACRADTIDGEFGVNPNSTTYTSTASLFGAGGFAGQRGRFNRAYMPSYNGLTAGNYDNYGYDGTTTLRKVFAYVKGACLALHPYFHQITDQPTSFDVGLNFYAEWLADTDAAVAAGNAVVVRPTDLERLTYWRSDDVYMRWDGEWVYRHDPTKIAF